MVTLGVLSGIFVGVLPGIGAITAIALLLPLTYHFGATASLILLAGIWYGATFGGSITAILLNIPGTTANAVTCIDGHPLTKQGKGSLALVIAVASSFLGGSVGILVIALLTAPIAKVALNFSSVEYFALIVLGLTERCASLRMIDFPHDRPGEEPGRPLHEEKRKARAGERSDAVEEAVAEAVAAIEEDGAEVIMFSCSGLFWLQPFVQARLDEMGWEVPVLHGYRCAIAVAKMMIDLNLSASGLMFPGDRPVRRRRKRLF